MSQRPYNAPSRTLHRRLLLGLATVVGAPTALAQAPTELRYSLDFQGPLMGVPAAPLGAPFTDADLLVRRGTPFNPQNPSIAIPGAFLAQYSVCAGHAPGVACGTEINAFSFGKDARLRPDAAYEFTVYVSVDEFAVGRPVLPGTNFPTIFTEAQQREAAADVFARRFLGPGPFQNIPGQSGGVADGDGRPASVGAAQVIGLGLPEPIAVTAGVPETGSNIDGIDLGPEFDPANDRLYFSLQGAFGFCNEPLAPNFDAALAQPLPGGALASSADILFFQVGQPVGRYASALELGLDAGGRGSDDIDAIMVVENGTDGYQPPTGPYSWLGPNATDLVLYSVRCGSDVVGNPDSLSGLPISEGDILINFAGAARPGIWIPAETLGLETVARGGMMNDELDGFDILDDGEEPFRDCNGNGKEDFVDILNGTSSDCDSNGIPDECELPGVPMCDCTTGASSACGNTAGADEGCSNNLGLGGKIVGMGTSSIETDVLELTVSQVTPNTFGLVVLGDVSTSVTVGNGRLCLGMIPGVSGTPFRLAVRPTGAMGGFTYGPGILGTISSSPASGAVAIGTTVGFQTWYRDVGGPCGAGSNFTNAIAVTLTP